MPTSLDERNQRNPDRDWVQIFAAFSIALTLFVAVLVVSNRYPLAGKWISDAVQAEFAEPNAPSNDKTAEQPRNIVHAAKTR